MQATVSCTQRAALSRATFLSPIASLAAAAIGLAAVLDIDGFKEIDDRYGHKAGDVVLAHMGKLLPESVRGSDVPARIGGDEFAVIMPATNKEGAYVVAAKTMHKHAPA